MRKIKNNKVKEEKPVEKKEENNIEDNGRIPFNKVDYIFYGIFAVVMAFIVEQKVAIVEAMGLIFAITLFVNYFSKKVVPRMFIYRIFMLLLISLVSLGLQKIVGVFI